MSKKIKKLMALVVAAVITAGGVFAYSNVYAAEEDVNVSDILKAAIEDEYMARATYELIIEKFDVQRPFTNLVKAEENHINELLPLLETYGVVLEDKDYKATITLPETLSEVIALGITAEENNIKLYEEFLNKDLPDDVKAVFENLLNASNRHLNAFMRQENNSCLENGNSGQGMGKNGTGKMGNGSGSGMGMGKGSENGSGDGSGNCTFE